MPAPRSSTAHASATLRARAVGAVVHHRAERVRHRDEARGDRDVVAGEPVRVAGPVEVLVVVQDRRGERPQRRDLRHDLRADPRVQLDHFALLGVQRPGLEQDALGHPDGPDVVQQRRQRQQAALVRLDVQPPADRLRVAGDLRRMPVQQRDPWRRSPRRASARRRRRTRAARRARAPSGASRRCDRRARGAPRRRARRTRRAAPRTMRTPWKPVAQVDRDGEKVAEPVRRDLAVHRIRGEGVAREALREGLARRVVVEPA